MASQTLSSIPIVDLSKQMIPGTPSWLETCAKVRHALEEYGCFVALSDQVTSKLNKETFDAVKELFDLPLETKLKNTSDILFNGYVGQLPHAPLHESTGIPNATTIEGVESFTHLMWPSGNAKFSNAIISYSKMVANLENLVDKMVFESYGAGKHFEKHMETTTYLLRPIRYTPFQEGLENGEIGSNVHTDKGFLAILNQTQVNALKVETRDGKWIDVDFPPESFVVMAGDAYEAWSNGRILSTKHQVIMNGDKPRYCLAMFTLNEGTIEIPEELVDEDHPLQYKPFENMGLVHFYLGGTSDMTGSTAKTYCGITTQNK
ncbi:OLC1v1038601C1 [Oldenlandia corymbosa var. corymbosa]|uniref:OLC1v1038601C1 n=1 Tax=Oldenlandia corymbosa var. corymbosa TaxID=529605 RepID=A0AAV1D3B1_OLDCO|nr:OLC1v1038601C1 [Oldenlandia corymbosa var. corymbosa]